MRSWPLHTQTRCELCKILGIRLKIYREWLQISLLLRGWRRSKKNGEENENGLTVGKRPDKISVVVDERKFDHLVTHSLWDVCVFNNYSTSYITSRVICSNIMTCFGLDPRYIQHTLRNLAKVHVLLFSFSYLFLYFGGWEGSLFTTRHLF